METEFHVFYMEWGKFLNDFHQLAAEVNSLVVSVDSIEVLAQQSNWMLGDLVKRYATMQQNIETMEKNILQIKNRTL